MHGTGKSTMFQGQIIYEGDFKHDKKTGKGEVWLPKHECHVKGEFDQNELMQGEAQIHYKAVHYDGEVTDSAACG